MTPVFHERNGLLHCEGLALADLARDYGTPAYVYSRAAIEAAYRAYDQAFGEQPHRVCFAVKANSNLAVLALLARLGAGFDIVSGGELARVLKAGGDPGRVVFSGVGKQAWEIAAALDAGVASLNVESPAELGLIEAVATERGVVAPVALRVNPDVDAQTHPYIATGMAENKFGIDIDLARQLALRVADSPHLELVGIACHIGSQLTSLAPFSDAVQRVLALVDDLAEAGIEVAHLDLGGGLGIRYRDEQPPAHGDYVRALLAPLAGRRIGVSIEPGRSIVGAAGALLTRVELLKSTPAKHFAVVDAAMNDLIRPSLYQAWQAIQPLHRRDAEPRHYDVVGPVCETGDYLGKDRSLAIEAGDLLAVLGAGAYGFVMASNYNSRPRPPELLVDGDRVHLIRARESLDDLWRGEHIPDLDAPA